MLEWQTESSLFTIRVRGRQWYWVYKIELRDLLKANNVAKNVGHNYWEVFKKQASEQENIDLNLIELRKHSEDYLKALKNRLAGLQNTNNTYGSIIGDNSTSINLTHANFNPNKKTLRAHSFNLLPYVSVCADLTICNNKIKWLNSANIVASKDLPDNLYFVLKQKRFAPAVKKVNSVNFKKLEKHLNLLNNELLVLKEQHSNV